MRGRRSPPVPSGGYFFRPNPNGSRELRYARRTFLSGTPKFALDAVEQGPVAAQRCLGEAQQPILVGAVQPLLDERARVGGVLLVERGVQAEVVGPGALR